MVTCPNSRVTRRRQTRSKRAQAQRRLLRLEDVKYDQKPALQVIARASQPATHVHGKNRVAGSVAPLASRNGYLRVRNRASALRPWDGILQRG